MLLKTVEEKRFCPIGRAKDVEADCESPGRARAQIANDRYRAPETGLAFSQRKKCFYSFHCSSRI